MMNGTHYWNSKLANKHNSQAIPSIKDGTAKLIWTITISIVDNNVEIVIDSYLQIVRNSSVPTIQKIRP